MRSSSMGRTEAVNPAATGTKAAAHYRLEIGAGQSAEVRLCLTDSAAAASPFAAFAKTIDARRREADEFYATCAPRSANEDAALVVRQAFGGLFWTKQYFFFDVSMWLREHGIHPLHSPGSVSVRNRHWFHMFNDDIISMPDKWDTRGTRRGTSRFTRWHWRPSTRISPSISSP